ncbi:DUF3958 family protein [Candidatus Enterococcus mansonii]|uniref:Uncharacterized protein n=1 Tax=Candidatus Enterococcus mansonii TaxID=1834181 RepID=A0A242CI09_9ENTE|nr:DUF3958 family protein [Enterococcus sp. 4G2_DIV0659]OTO09412.1 hypothetical protein A5880_000091 [Enterococcus sp. 4G2_DIV0659]
MTEANYQETLRTIQTEQDLVKSELRSIEEQQEAIFYLNQEEQRLYSEIIATSPPEERTFFQDRELDSLEQGRKAQHILAEQEAALMKTKKQLLEAEEETYQKHRNALREKEKEKE